MNATRNPIHKSPQRVAIAGASGLIGRALADSLRTSGRSVVRLVRGGPDAPDTISWDPAVGRIAAEALEGFDAIVNLAGENVGEGRWTAARRKAIRQSRTAVTRTLVAAIARLRRKPGVLVNASAVGFYGERGEDLLTETSSAGRGFLAEVCQAWEAEAFAAERAGVRVVVARFGVVLARQGGALAKMLPLFRCGLGGRMGDGRQWMSWITLADAVRALAHLMERPQSHGPYNLTAPEPVTNARFTAALAAALRRPAVFPAPAWGLRTVLGEMADATVLASARAVPAKLREEGFRFDQPEIATALQAFFAKS